AQSSGPSHSNPDISHDLLYSGRTYFEKKDFWRGEKMRGVTRCRAHEMAVLVCNKRGFDFQVRRKDSMKGVVLAGGKGSRLYPLSRVTNKHLLPVYDRPMVFYPIQTLVDAGIKDIIIVTGGQNSGDFLRLLSNGKDFDLHRIHYTYQEGEGGIADALRLAEPFVEGEKICVILGD